MPADPERPFAMPEIVLGFIEYATLEKNIESFPPLSSFEDRVWDDFLYSAYKELGAHRPELDCLADPHWNDYFPIYPEMMDGLGDSLLGHCLSDEVNGRLIWRVNGKSPADRRKRESLFDEMYEIAEGIPNFLKFHDS